MEWTTIIQELGGGLPAVIIAGLAFAYWKERQRGQELTDRAISREREHAQELYATISAVEKLTQMIGGGK